ncbi:MAG TPA: hypothetical protein VEJ38_13430 [Candidatus Acidoferrales bacterium]|nr:hypothetical protein [Candidatus Acidoferrales bacterium]
MVRLTLKLGMELLREVLFTLGGAAFLWALASMFWASHQARAFGISRVHHTTLILGSRPTDPHELVVWRWTLQFCCGTLLGVLCVVGCVFLRH